MLGVPMPTLRSWELRYGIPALSRRPPGQHRRYLPEEVNALRLMRDEIARGQQAGVAAQSVRRLLGGQGPAQELIHRILGAAERLDAASIRALLDEAAATLGLAACIDDVLLPAMRQIGVWWAVGHCDVVQERMATEAVRAWLDRRRCVRARHRPGPVRSCWPADPAICTPSAWNQRRCCCATRAGRAGYWAPGPRPSPWRPRRGPPRSPGSSWCPIWRPGDSAPSNRSAPSTTWASRSSTPGTRSPPRGVAGGSRAATSASASQDACAQLTRALAPTDPGPVVGPAT